LNPPIQSNPLYKNDLEIKIENNNNNNNNNVVSSFSPISIDESSKLNQSLPSINSDNSNSSEGIFLFHIVLIINIFTLLLFLKIFSYYYYSISHDILIIISFIEIICFYPS
jgi:hypothetical protein